MTIREFDLLDLVENAAISCAEDARSGKHALVGYMEPQLARKYIGDPDKLKHIFEQLAHCAMQSDDELDICIRATNGNIHRDKGIGPVPLRFAVHYTHVGACPPNTESAEELIESLGGKLAFGIEKGKGSFFSFVLDLQASLNQINRPLYADDLQGIPMFVLSNEPPPNRAIHGNLRYWGLRCDGAPTFQEGILEISRQATLDNPYKLIIVSQPIEDGSAIDVAEEIRSSALSTTKLIHIDRFYDEGSRKRSLEAGFNFYMAKPFTTHELLAAITEQLDVELRMCVTPKSPLVLVVDDNLTNQKMAMFQLRRLGITCDLAANGKEALAALNLKEYVLLFMDLHMPIMDGCQALRRIREQPRFKDLPIIMLTTDESGQARESCWRAGASDFFLKPLDNRTMLNIINRWCSLHDTGDLRNNRIA